MADYGAWNAKGATLSEVTAQKEYGVDREFIIKGIRAGKLEYREDAIWGNPYLRLLRSQMEKYIGATLGKDYLVKKKSETELRSVKKELGQVKNRMMELETRRIKLEKILGKRP